MDVFNNISLVPLATIPKGKACPIDDLGKLYKLSLLMQELCEKEKGIGLSAVQVGIPYNLFVIKFENYRTFVNCTYTPLSENKRVYVEGCLSIRAEKGALRYFVVPRYESVRIEGYELVDEPDLQLVALNITPTDFSKCVFQHEIDHSFDITIDKIGQEVAMY